MREQVDSGDSAVAQIAAAQFGVVTFVQLREAGIDKSGVARRVAAGRLHRVHRGVYAVGHPALGLDGTHIAAVFACGLGAALSHGAAAVHWGLLRPIDGPIDVSVPTSAGRVHHKEVRVHRCRSLALSTSSRIPRTTRHAPLLTVHRGISVTTVARTLDDIRTTLAPYLVRRATRQAELAGHEFGDGAAGQRTRSDLEDDFLALCRRHRIPAPDVNVKVGPWTVDFLWRSARLAVETDFYDYHRGRVAFQDDRARDLGLRRRGFAVRRYSEAQVNKDAAAVAADLRDALGLAS